MLDALFRQIIKERRIPFAIALPTTPTDETPTPSTLNNNGTLRTTTNYIKGLRYYKYVRNINRNENQKYPLIKLIKQAYLTSV